MDELLQELKMHMEKLRNLGLGRKIQFGKC